MSFLDRFRQKEEKKKLEKMAEKQTAKDLTSKKSVKEKSEKKIVKNIKSKFKGAHGILMKPLITEKISSVSSMGKYAFLISSDANKPMVKKAITALYGVNVKNVRIINVIGKKVRYGRSYGQRSDWKKAIVTLAPGEKIEIYEGV